jgi:PEGA domain
VWNAVRRDPDSSAPGSGAVATGGRPGKIVGTAVPRGSVPVPSGGGVTVAPGGFYPWEWGYGVGFGGYYGGYYDPFGPNGGHGYGGAGSSPSSSQDDDDGALKLKVKPREASVYADGSYVGRVDDFDGVFQHLRLSAGPHRIEICAPEYEPLAFDVMIAPGETVTYQGELKKVSPPDSPAAP